MARQKKVDQVKTPDAAHIARYKQLVAGGDKAKLETWLRSRGGTNLAAKRAPYEAAVQGIPPGGVSPPGYPAGPTRPIVPPTPPPTEAPSAPAPAAPPPATNAVEALKTAGPSTSTTVAATAPAAMTQVFPGAGSSAAAPPPGAPNVAPAGISGAAGTASGLEPGLAGAMQGLLTPGMMGPTQAGQPEPRGPASGSAGILGQRFPPSLESALQGLMNARGRLF